MFPGTLSKFDKFWKLALNYLELPPRPAMRHQPIPHLILPEFSRRHSFRSQFDKKLRFKIFGIWMRLSRPLFMRIDPCQFHEISQQIWESEKLQPQIWPPFLEWNRPLSTTNHPNFWRPTTFILVKLWSSWLILSSTNVEGIGRSIGFNIKINVNFKILKFLSLLKITPALQGTKLKLLIRRCRMRS